MVLELFSLMMNNNGRGLSLLIFDISYIVENERNQNPMVLSGIFPAAACHNEMIRLPNTRRQDN